MEKTKRLEGGKKGAKRRGLSQGSHAPLEELRKNKEIAEPECDKKAPVRESTFQMNN